MSSTIPLKGIVAYPITRFGLDGHVDLKTYRQLLERLLTSGVQAIAPLGSAGVLPYLSDEEREAITEATIAQVAGRVPVMIGVSALTTERTLHHAKFAEKAGAAAVMIIPMSYWKLTEDEIFQHYQTVSEAISLPIMAYNNPATGGSDMSPTFLARLLQLPNVTMIKESTGDVNRLHRLVQTAGDSVAFFNGSNPLAFDAFAAGATGWCTAAANLIPDLNLALYQAFREPANLENARAVFLRQLPLLQFLVAHGLPRTVAAGLELAGIEVGPLRAPLLPLSESHRAELQRLLKQVRESHE
ncbi:dihydrodipicolinate synthase family protein [Bremerella cremea]|uniref:Dihydrodipicolinate synthase family protein n=1 Tax=Bremerella cremea TaxID=1031537 RepID=A0A368KTX1_9BACT|nr:dihydrodipicolinate synthase family protein [Bremerella cremea]RCS53873.1 dihydrodipicolinate synthase family protein [Bremerella cremea]